MRKKALQDLILVLLLGILTYLISSRLELFESLILWIEDHGYWQVEEILLAVAISSIFWVLFSMRRWRESYRENLKREKAEAMLSENNELLEQRVSRRTDELVSMNKQLQHTINALQSTKEEKNSLEQQVVQSQKLESIGVLTSGIAHDFNNLLTAINGYADLVIIKTAGYGKDIQNDLEKIRNAGEKASGLTRKLLAFSRKQVFNLKFIDLNFLIEDVVNMAARLIGENIRLQLKLSSEICQANADKTQVEQVLMNLLINARDAMPEGGDLTIVTSIVTLDEEYAGRRQGVVPGEYVLVSVSDTGQGIPTEIQDKIFDPFFTTKEPGKGTGLGLATVYGIIKQHKGNIWVYSKPGFGTTFKVYFPATFQEVTERKDKGDDQVAHGNERILVVDDDGGVRSFVQDTLEFYKYDVVTASSGRDALKEFNSSDTPFDLLLTDVIMPEMNGWELSRTVRQKWPSIKVVFMSGYEDQKVPMDQIEGDPNLSFVSKPLSTSMLVKKIRDLLDSS